MRTMVKCQAIYCISGNDLTTRHSKMGTYSLIILLICCLCSWKRLLCILPRIRRKNTCSGRTLSRILPEWVHSNRIWAHASRWSACWKIRMLRINRSNSINSNWIVNLSITLFKNKKTISLISAINPLIMAICNPLSNSRWKSHSPSLTSFNWSQKPSLQSLSSKTLEKPSTTLLMTPIFSTISRW